MIMANLAIRFLVEFGGVAALGYWGFHVPASFPVPIVAGLAAPALLAVLWGTFLAPRAHSRIPPVQRVHVGTVVLEGTAVALVATGLPAIGIGFGGLILANAVLLLAFEPPAATAH